MGLNPTTIDWTKNPDGTQGYTWNPITGCLNGCDYCYARKLANTRLRKVYLANTNVAPFPDYIRGRECLTGPFHPRFWEDRLDNPIHNFRFHHIPGGQRYQDRGIFVCDMSDLFGIGIPHEWTEQVLETIKQCPHDRFYLLTKQPQNLIKFSPFPDNCWVGFTATGDRMLQHGLAYIADVEAKLKYVSFEPLLERVTFLAAEMVDWVIIGAQTKPYKPPKIEWVQEIIQACDKAGIPVFLKNNLEPLWTSENRVEPFFKFSRSTPGATEIGILRQEMPDV